jgi:hypothetical protein
MDETSFQLYLKYKQKYLDLKYGGKKKLKKNNHHKILNYGQQYEKAIKDKDSILQKIEYPYTKYFITEEEIKKYFDTLKKYQFTIQHVPYHLHKIKITDDELKFQGKYHLIIDDPSEYPKIETISDYFNENCRVKCSFKNQETSLHFFRNNFGQLINYLKRQNKEITLYQLHEAIYKIGPSQCAMFKPKLIKYFIELFRAKKILDISSGWGDRLIGAMSCEVDEYHGFDPNPCLHPNYQSMIKFFQPTGKYIIEEKPFEEAKLKDNYYDLIMTYPPYFDVEIYVSESDPASEKQSISHQSEKSWYQNFLMKWIKIGHQALKPQGILALNIHQSKEYHFVDWLLSEMKEKNSQWKYLGVISHAKNEIKKNPRPIFIWQKIIS